MGDETLFQKLMRGALPCHKVYEDARVFAFLDIAPLSSGHTLLVPKQPAQTLDALSDESAAALGRVLPRLCRAVQKASGAAAYNVLQNNGALAHQAVPHVHFHIIPRPSDTSGLTVQWTSGRLTEEDGTRLCAAIAAAL